MTERRRTKAEEKNFARLLQELHENEAWFETYKLRDRMIPPGWHGLEETAPVRPKKTRITAAYDADVARWFRGLGQGYQARMNAVLRVYMLAVISKEIERRGDRDWKGDPI